MELSQLTDPELKAQRVTWTRRMIRAIEFGAGDSTAARNIQLKIDACDTERSRRGGAY